MCTSQSGSVVSSFLQFIPMGKNLFLQVLLVLHVGHILHKPECTLDCCGWKRRRTPWYLHSQYDKPNKNFCRLFYIDYFLGGRGESQKQKSLPGKYIQLEIWESEKSARQLTFEWAVMSLPICRKTSRWVKTLVGEIYMREAAARLCDKAFWKWRQGEGATASWGGTWDETGAYVECEPRKEMCALLGFAIYSSSRHCICCLCRSKSWYAMLCRYLCSEALVSQH